MLLKEHAYEDGSKILAQSLGLASEADNFNSPNINTSNLNINNKGENMANAQIQETNEVAKSSFHFKNKKVQARKKVVSFSKHFPHSNATSPIANDEVINTRSHLNLVESEEDYPHDDKEVYIDSDSHQEESNVATASTHKFSSSSSEKTKKESLNTTIKVAKNSGLFVKYVSIGTAKIYTSFLMTMLSSILFMVQNISPILQGTFNLALPAFSTWLISTKIPHVTAMMNTLAPQAKILCYASFYFGSFFTWVTACLILTNLANGIGLGMKKLAQIGEQSK